MAYIFLIDSRPRHAVLITWRYLPPCLASASFFAVSCKVYKLSRLSQSAVIRYTVDCVLSWEVVISACGRHNCILKHLGFPVELTRYQPCASVEFVEAVGQLPSLVRQVAVPRTEQEQVTRGTQPTEDQEQNILREQHEQVRVDQMQSVPGIASEGDIQIINEHVDAAASPIRAPSPIEFLKQVSLLEPSLVFRVHIGLQKRDCLASINGSTWYIVWYIVWYTGIYCLDFTRN